jgi:serine/threonine protein kinase
MNALPAAYPSNTNAHAGPNNLTNNNNAASGNIVPSGMAVGPTWRSFRIGRTGRALRFSSAVNCELGLTPRHFQLPPVAHTGDISSHNCSQSMGRVAPGSIGSSSLLNATVRLLAVFKGCDASFTYDMALNPRRVLTKPNRPFHNNGHDNEKWDYILHVNDILGEEEGRRFLVLDLLGHGTFGQVCKCQNVQTRQLCAVKVIKNQPAYFNQSRMEVSVLELLNGQYDAGDHRHIVRMLDAFVFCSHLCIVVELLSLNLYELIKQNQYRGFSLGLVRIFLAQTLDALQVLKEARIVHCDLKPENILLVSVDSPAIKVIDFGSACHENQTLYTYIQSRFYRSPEVLLGLPYTSAIDMWSLGCIAGELFLGLPIFPGASNYDQLSRMVECLGTPPLHMLDLGKDARLYFDKHLDSGRSYGLKTRERYGMERGRVEPPSKRYFQAVLLADLVLTYPLRPRDLQGPDLDAEMHQRRCFLDLLRGLLQYNPLERWTPAQAMLHPFITGRPWDGLPFDPFLAPQHLASNIPQATNLPPNQMTMRGRSNTLGSLSRQTVPKPMQRVGEAAAADPGPVPSDRPLPDNLQCNQGTSQGSEQDNNRDNVAVGSVDTFALVANASQTGSRFMGQRPPPVKALPKPAATLAAINPNAGSLPQHVKANGPSSGINYGGARRNSSADIVTHDQGPPPTVQASTQGDYYVHSPLSLGHFASPSTMAHSRRASHSDLSSSPNNTHQQQPNNYGTDSRVQRRHSLQGSGAKRVIQRQPSQQPSSPPSTGTQLMSIDELEVDNSNVDSHDQEMDDYADERTEDIIMNVDVGGILLTSDPVSSSSLAQQSQPTSPHRTSRRKKK